MTTAATTLPGKFHDAVIRWQETYLSDFDFLVDNWEKYFPNDQRFRLCAYREQGICGEIECGELEGQPKFTQACDMDPKRAHQLLGAIRAQASTEFGSIQQHRLTLARAQHEQDQMWVLRMMAEELRHGYQMLHLLLDDDWSHVSEISSADMVEEILSMTTGSHVLGAFNIDFDSFVDNVVFCALIDRVGKFQLAMQQVSAYKPMAESMPPMLREEAFHLATGVVPMRRWVTQAAQGEVYVTMEGLQRAWNKWLPRGLEMFGDERGGGTNVRLGLKPMKNKEAQEGYYKECGKVLRDLNMRYLRARLPKLSRNEAIRALDRILEGEVVQGVGREALLHLPDQRFYRRRGLPAFEMIGTQGEVFEDVAAYTQHLSETLPESYRASADFRGYVDLLRQVNGGEVTAHEASSRAPALRRVGGSCPCSKSVRWVVDSPAESSSLETPLATP
ncbi:MAG: phenylacetate-CoA oxygenase subunit PaaI [Deltaproteobacteria bacterium]|nr:phenylacetate-CoA oxygenase subunit PaaI [Deltaproteobacteria bacterium]